MPQEESQEVKELRRQMREGRTPLIEAVRAAYQPYLIARKGWERENAELREQVGLLSSEFSNKGKQLRESSRKSQDSGAGMVDLYKELGRQAKAVSALIDKELPNLSKLYEPVGELHDAYRKALADYEAYMASWQGKLSESDLGGRALELALQEVERSLR
jgi:chromosome segregation ATPase